MTATHHGLIGTKRLGTAPAPGELSATERISRDELQARQLDRLRYTLRYTYDRVPAYRQKFDAAGVHPDDCRDLSDLVRFPTTSKLDLRDNYPFGMFAVPREQIVRILLDEFREMSRKH